MSDRHQLFMNEALAEASLALSLGEFPVGCVLVYQGQVVARGRRQGSGGHGQRPVNEIDHAEVLALRELITHRPEVPLAEVVVYATLEPCLMCYATLIISGVRQIVYAYEDAMGGGTGVRLDQLPPLYQAMSVSVTPHVRREESLRLFQRFFAADHSFYLSNTILADYTLAQP